MEYVTWERIKDRLPTPTHDPYNQRALGGCNNEALKYPDVVWASLDRVIHLEIDENSHADREVNCELKKLDATNYGVEETGKKRVTIIIRFNPDSCDTTSVSTEERHMLLVNELKDKMAMDVCSLNPLLCHVVFLFYHSKGHKHVQAAEESPNVAVMKDPRSHY